MFILKSQGQTCGHANAPSVSVVSIILLSAALWEHPKHVQADNNLWLNQQLFSLAVHPSKVKWDSHRTAEAVQTKIKAHVHTRSHTHKDQMCRVNKMMGGN